MAVPTTLITFRIRAPSTARTVQLYGSWDNFSAAYGMQRDRRISPDHWTGCHTFSNIICDGDPSTMKKPRNGGLKMGGKYWYYYKIDDEIDFHNTSEPSTTACPMLPGQLVNVLDLPFAFTSSARSRNASSSSLNSEKMTMDPKDKFMRPRPAPARPAFLRVTTSPTSDSHSRSTTPVSPFTPMSANDNNATTRRVQLSRKASYDTFVPSSGKSAGLRTAFKIRTARSRSPEARILNIDPKGTRGRRAASSERAYDSPTITPTADHIRPSQRGLLFRSTSDDTIPTSSFLQNRRQRSLSREAPNTMQKSVPQDVDTHATVPVSQFANPPLSTLKEVSSSQNTPISDTPVIFETNASQLNLEKRLPTLPNTPSSAYPQSFLGNSSPRKDSLDIVNLESHFSTTTIDTAPRTDSINFTKETSHFSNWTTASSLDFPSLELLPPMPKDFGDDTHRVRESDLTKGGQDTYLPPAFSSSSISSTVSTTPSTSYFDTDVELTESPTFRKTGQLHLHGSPDDYGASALTLKNYQPQTPRFNPVDKQYLNYESTKPTNTQNVPMIHSDSMQKLLDELSYLSDMIQQ